MLMMLRWKSDGDDGKGEEEEDHREMTTIRKRPVLERSTDAQTLTTDL
jgi:hypothetical protein